jgi:hypothetical protein
MTSKIKVDNIENQCGGAVVTKCGATTTISGSVVKADDIQAADGGNLINQCGTLGASGDTISLASGASQTGFGRTGTVDWDTTPKTSTVTAANGVGYFVDTTSGSVTVNLPVGSAGAIVAIADYANTADTNKIVIAANGTEKIQGVASNPFEITVEGGSVTLVYVDSTQGWRPTDASTAAAITENDIFISATGGTITCSGDYKIHTFTGPGTFCVSAGAGPVAVVDYLVVAGGGAGAGGGYWRSNNAGGGAGGYRESPGTASGAYAVSPLGVAPAVALPVSVQGYAVTVGAGGVGAPGPNNVGASGSNSIFSSITSTGGGGGGASSPPTKFGLPGGSGGGYQQCGPSPSTPQAGTGNTPPVSPPQGNPGGFSPLSGGGGPAGGSSGGGGGAGAAGSNAPGATVGGAGGAGVTSSINTSPVTRAGGGGGAGNTGAGAGGPGGGGAGASGCSSGSNGTVNTGGGGGGGAADTNCIPTTSVGGSGGSGVVIIRYKYQ